MEELLNRVVNLAVGAMMKAKEGVLFTSSQVEKEIEELIEKGSKAEDNNSLVIKEYTDHAIKYLNSLNRNIEKAAHNTKPIIQDALAYLERIKGENQKTSQINNHQL